MLINLTKAERLELENAVINFEAARDNLHEKATEIAQRLFNEHDEKSDKWKESESGQAAETLVEAIQQLADDAEGFQIDVNF